MTRRTVALIGLALTVVAFIVVGTFTVLDKPEPGSVEAVAADTSSFADDYAAYGDEQGFLPPSIDDPTLIGSSLAEGHEIKTFQGDSERYEFCIVHTETKAWVLYRKGDPFAAPDMIHGLDGRIVGRGPANARCKEDKSLPGTKVEVADGDYDYTDPALRDED